MIHFFEKRKEGQVLRVIVQPKSRKSEFVGLHGSPARLKIKLFALPIEGAANRELISFLSKELKIPKSKIFIIKGELSRQKDVLLSSEKDFTDFFKQF